MRFGSDSDKRLLKALVAEDDPGIRRLIAELLQMDGWEVREAADGDQAVTIAGDWRPDAVVIDVMMPVKDGLTALREIRSMEGGDGVGVLVVSAKAGIEQEARDAGTDEFLAKPFEHDELPARTRAALRWHRADVGVNADATDAR